MGEIADGLIADGMADWYPLPRYRSRRRRKPSGPGPCPRCGKPTRLREGSNGKFYGCRDFPECKGNRDYVVPKK